MKHFSTSAVFSLCVCACMLATKAKAQNTFQILYGSTEEYFVTEAYYTTQTQDGGSIATGLTYNYTSSDGDVFLLKTNADGTLQWFKIYTVDVSGDLKSSQAAAVEQTADGGYIIAGSTYSVFGYDDVFVLKTDSAGNIQWHKVFGGSGYDAAAAVKQTSSGDYIVVGHTNSFGTGTPSFQNIYALKLSGTGTILWTQTYDNSINDNDEANVVLETTDGNYVVGGTTTSLFNSFTQQDAALLKINSADGSIIWSKSYGGASGNDVCLDIKQAVDGGFILAGRTNSFSASQDCFLLKIDAAGNTIQWAKTYATSDAGNSEWAYSVAVTADGGYAVYGDVFYAASAKRYELLIKTDNGGIVSWTNRYGSGNNDYGNKVVQTRDKGYLLAAFEIADFTFSGTTAHITKTDSNGVSGCFDSAVNIITTSQVFAITPGPQAIAGGGSIGNETVTASNEFLPVTVLCQTPAPELKFTSFEGTHKNEKNILTWKTKSEMISDDYIIERSLNRRNFVAIGKVNATFKTLSKQPYKFIDYKQTGGTNYYRVKAVRKQGKTVYSNIITIKTNGGNLITINTTNAPGMFLIKSEKEYDAPYVEYDVYNFFGAKVHHGKVENGYGKIFSTINLSFLHSGVYFVNFNSTEQTAPQKIIVTN